VNVLAYGSHDMVALTETPCPLRFDPKTLETLGPFQWSDGLKSELTTAHPHYDAARQLIYNLETSFGRKSFYRFTRMAPGSKCRSVVAEIETSEPAYTHSFTMSECNLILAEFPLVTTPLRLLFGGRPFIESYRWLPARGVRFTVIDKETGAIVRRAEAGACFSFHHVNAFDEDGAVVLDLLAYPDARVIDAFYLAELRAGKAIPQSLLTRFVIPLGERPVTETVLSAAPLELPRIAYHRIAGRRHRYVWDHDGARAGLCAACHSFRLSRKLFSGRRIAAAASRSIYQCIHNRTVMSESPDTLSIAAVFAAQRETAIALRASTAAMRIEKLKRLEAAVLAHRDAITRALAADLHRSEAETEFLELLPVIAGLRHTHRHLTSWMKPRSRRP
jgi:hypothetical protein